MRIGVISDTRLLRVKQGRRRWSVYGFSISASDLSFFELMGSAFATPARYVWELFRRLDALEDGPAREPLFIFNPLFHIDAFGLHRALQTLCSEIDTACISVLVDVQHRPVGYFFPPSTARDRLHKLSLLSTVDGGVDARLLELMFQCRVDVHQVHRLDLARAHHNGFLYDAVRSIYLDLARLAIRYLEIRFAEPADDGREDPVFTAWMPRHAGDVLFFSLAYASGPSHIGRVAVQSAYADIVAYVAPHLSVLPIDAPGGGAADSEAAFFNAHRNTLTFGGLYYFARQSRDANTTGFHLIDHFGFALGHACCTLAQLPSRRLAKPSPAELRQPDRTRLLLHFDGGWPLKVYPESLQDRLIELLLDRGYTLTLLTGRRTSHPRCEVVNFRNLADLGNRLADSQLVIGMDSFPAHFSAFVIGTPTICLFGNTRPANAAAATSDHYAMLERGLACRPCNAVETCLRNGSGNCGNFVKPEDVVCEVVRLLDQRATLAPAPTARVASAPANETGGTDLLILRQPRSLDLSMRKLAVRAAVARIIHPHASTLSMLWAEFRATVHLDGPAGAWWRTLRFLRRVRLRNTPR